VKRLSGLILVAWIIAASHAAAESDPVVLSIDPSTQPARAQQPAVKVFKYTNRLGTTSFSDRAPANRRYEVIKVMYGCYACNPGSRVNWHSTPLNLKDFQKTVNTAAVNYGIDPALVRAVIHAESAFKPNAKSRAGALGLMQLMPDTASDMGVADPMSPEDNIHGGVRYLAWLLQKTNGNTMLATAAYNAGPGAVERHNGIPPYEETETYVKRVRILHGRYRKALTKGTAALL
jgi:soluble lytic murein transglycosylase-like protein